jgi:ADP-heptose:LPS heptosyltransferase
VDQAPKHILYIRPDTFGDIALFEPVLRVLMGRFPATEHSLLVREGYETLAPLFPPALGWISTTLNPFKQSPSEGREELSSLLNRLAPNQPDVVIAPTLNRTWLEVALAAHFPNARRIALGGGRVDALFVRALELEFGIKSDEIFAEIVAIDDGAREWENNFLLVDHLLGARVERTAPALSVPPDLATAAAQILAQKGLSSGGWIAVVPGGLANVPIKSWPLERFAEVVASLERSHGLPVLIIGHQSEQSLLDTLASQVAARGARRPPTWSGRDGEIALLTALLATSRLYFGHDTGPMHLAAGVGRPVVALFGGGHWPRFRPVGRQVVSVVQPLPCFGCNWDCHFGDAPCVKTMTVASVQAAISRVLAAGSDPIDDVVESRGLQQETLGLIATVTANYRKVQGDRLERQHKIEELTHLGREKDVEMEALKQSAEDRKVEMEAIKAELEAECASKDTEIAELKQSAEDRKTEMEAIKAELEAECASKDVEIHELKDEANTKDAEIGSIKQIANEREQLIITMDGHIKHFQQAVADLQTRITQLEGGVRERQARLDELDDKLSHLPPDALEWALTLKHKNVHVENLEGIIANLKAGIAERDVTMGNIQAGLQGLEAAKHFGRLLAEKEAVLQVLNTACVEREKVIQQLSLQAAGLGRLSQLWLGMRAHVRLKYTAPANAWLFKKIVGDYWMQIGILRHYEPRPLKWDRLPTSGLPESRLPKIGIITPSYGQETFIESTMLSVLNQNYPRLLYVVQDGGSKDASPRIIERYANQLTHWESVRDKGQADAIRKGFTHIENQLGAEDVMAWLNSDDLIAPRTLRYVGEYFAQNPSVDVIYGHRIIIDSHDKDVGRWIMPRHDPKSLEWIDYVPQETLFWRKRAWDLAGGIDPSFQFALDWDLLARFTQARCKVVRLPHFLGCFRVHSEQKTSQAIHTTGAAEMARIRQRFHGANQDNQEEIGRWARRIRRQGVLTARLADLGIRY